MVRLGWAVLFPNELALYVEPFLAALPPHVLLHTFVAGAVVQR